VLSSGVIVEVQSGGGTDSGWLRIAATIPYFNRPYDVGFVPSVTLTSVFWLPRTTVRVTLSPGLC
jgi:hypothetical protein